MMIPSKWQRPLWITALSVLLISLVFQPSAAYQAALRGLTLWWKVIAPALLPFFIISELLLEAGLSVYMGPILRPLMGPLFSLPGNAAMGVALGFCSGFPTGASIAAGLRRRGEITREQGERLTAFTNNAGPLYVTVSIAVGLLHTPKAGLILAAAHYGANLIIGMALGITAKKRENSTMPTDRTVIPQFSVGRAMKQAAERAAGNILIIGCYMVFFSVAAALPEHLLAETDPLHHALLLGMMEMSLGMDALAASGLSLREILPWSAAMLSFGGISVIMQVMAMLADTDISPTVYLLCRGIQAILSFCIAKLLSNTLFLPAGTLPAAEITVNLPLFSWALCLFTVLPGLIYFSSAGVSRL